MLICFKHKIMENGVLGKALIDFERIVREVSGSSYSQGEKQGRLNATEEYKQELQSEFERFATTYVIQEFSDCHTLADFQDKLKWIVAANCQYM